MFWLAALILISSTSMANDNFTKEKVADTLNYVSYFGKILDEATGLSLPFATIEAEGSNVATVSNIDGDFTIKIAEGSSVKNLKVSYVGYTNKVVALSDFNGSRKLTIKLSPRAIQLKELTIRPEEPEDIIEMMLGRIGQNYSDSPMMMTGFYRETVTKGKNYVSISEAVVDIFKAAYRNDLQGDQIRIFKGRKSADVEKMDTVLFKLQGGPSTTILLDVIKNPYILLSDNYRAVYDFNLIDIISINDKLHYVISFNQKAHVTAPFYQGKLYIDMDNLALSEAEFALNVENEEEAARMFIRKKPLGMSVIPEKALYRVKYTMQDGKWYFSYARAEVKFKVDWEKKLFNSTYSTMSEIAITDRTEQGVDKFDTKERFKRTDVLDEKVYIFFDQDFWGEYNVIEPDQSIETAIRRLNRKFLRTQE